MDIENVFMAGDFIVIKAVTKDKVLIHVDLVAKMATMIEMAGMEKVILPAGG